MEKLAFHSWCNKFILFRHKLSKYFVVAFYLFISTTIIFRITSQTYGVNDDVIIQDWLSGQYTGTPELMIRGSATPRITFGFIVSNLYDFIPNLNWFSIILLTTVLFSWYLLGILAFRSKNILSIFVYFLISFLHLLWYIPSPTYTASAVILSFSTLIYLARKLSERNINYNFILISIVYVFGFLIRPESFLLGTVVACPYILFSLIKERKVSKKEAKYILISAFFVLSIVGSDFVLERFYYAKNQTWNEYRIWETARYKIQANIPEKALIDDPNKFGWTQAEAEIFKNYDYIDSTNFTILKLNKLILDSRKATNIDLNFIQIAHQQIFDSDINWEWKPLIKLISFLYLLFFLFSLPRALSYISLASSSLVIIYLIMLYVAGFLRQPERVQVSVIFLSMLTSWVSFLYVPKSSKARELSAFNIASWMVFILSVSAFQSQASHLIRKMGESPNSFWQAEKELLNNFPKDSIFVGNASKFRNNWQSPYTINNSEVEKRILTFGWHNFSPHWIRRAENLNLDSKNVLNSIIEDPRVYWVTDSKSMEYIETYMKEQGFNISEPKIMGELSYWGDEYKVWDFSLNE